MPSPSLLVRLVVPEQLFPSQPLAACSCLEAHRAVLHPSCFSKENENTNQLKHVCDCVYNIYIVCAPRGTTQRPGSKRYDETLAEMLGNLPGILFHIGVASRPAHAKMALRCSGWCCKKSVRSLICGDTSAALKPRRKMSPAASILHLLYSYLVMETKLPFCIGEELPQ